MVKILIYLLFIFITYKIFKNLKISTKNKDDIIDAEYEEIE